MVVTVPIDELVGSLNTDGYRGRLREYLDIVSKDILEVGKIISTEFETGIVHWFDDTKGYGFIRGYDSKDVFVHWRGIIGDGFKTLKAGQQVRFKRRQGRETLEAIEVELRSAEGTTDVLTNELG